MNRNKAMSLEETLVALAVISVLTFVLMDTWRMTAAVTRSSLSETGGKGVVCDSISVSRIPIQERLDAAKLDSLKTVQERNEKAND